MRPFEFLSPRPFAHHWASTVQRAGIHARVLDDGLSGMVASAAGNREYRIEVWERDSERYGCHFWDVGDRRLRELLKTIFLASGCEMRPGQIAPYDRL